LIEKTSLAKPRPSLAAKVAPTAMELTVKPKRIASGLRSR
jgi:hypothetical protein